MVTRFYFSNSAAGFAPTAAQGTWNDTTLLATNTYALSKTKVGTNIAVALAEISATNNFKGLLHRHVSGPLVGGTMPAFTSAGAPFQHVQARQQSAAGMNASIQVHIYFTVGDTDTVRGTWFSNFTGGTAFATTLTAFSYTTPGQATTAVNVQPGDRMVIEVGYNAANTVTTSFTGTLRIGGTSADLATTGTVGVTTDSPWIEFPASADAVLGDLDLLAKTETITLTDTVGITKGRAATETITLTDSLAVVKNNNPSKTETIVLTDNVTWQFTRADITNYQFVVPQEPWVPFGPGQTIDITSFDPGTTEIRNQDGVSPRQDIRTFGIDRKTPPTWSWELWTNTYSEADALAWVESMASLWDDDVRENPGEVMPLRYHIADRSRLVYGRPRRFDYTVNKIQNGKVYIVADFALSEAIYYDDVLNTVTIQKVPNATGGSGVKLPQKLPWKFQNMPVPRTAQMQIAGSQKTWVDIEFWGPSLNPYVQIGALTWQLNGTIDAGQRVFVSGKPWQFGALRSSGAWAPDMLDVRSRLTQLQVNPGLYSVIYNATDNTGTSKAIVSWRAAHKSF